MSIRIFSTINVSKNFFVKYKIFIAILIAIFTFQVSVVKALPKQIDIQNAKININESGIPVMEIEGGEKVMNPSTIALYALGYIGYEDFSEDYYKLNISKDDAKFKECLEWLVNNLTKTEKNVFVWEYGFNHTYNDIIIAAPWYSAFGQAAGIQALLVGYKELQEKKYLDAAIKAAEVLMLPIKDAGLMFAKGDELWFEEVANSTENPSHILNGHMRALISLHMLNEVTGEKKYKDYFEKGMATLIKWLPKYDTGYWLRYDLNPRKEELLFRFSNPYGELANLAISKIVIKDPITAEEEVLNVGVEGDNSGTLRIAGIDWEQPIELDGQFARRLKPVSPVDYSMQLDGSLNHSPHTYFYMKLPSKWVDNLRSDWFELTVFCKDEGKANVNLQIRSIAPGPAFQWMRNGELFLTGSGEWREWKVPIHVSDLGFPCGDIYGEKHLQYLEKLSSWEPKLKDWVDLMRGYFNIFDSNHATETVKLGPQVIPKQTFMLPLYALDKEGVIRQYAPGEGTKTEADGCWDFISDFGNPEYQIYVIAEQARVGEKYSEIYAPFTEAVLKNNKFIKAKNIEYLNFDSENAKLIKREPAYKYLIEHAISKGKEGLIWAADFSNTYNDLVADKGWSSSFFQAYVVKAFKAAVDDDIKFPEADYKELLKKALMGYFVPVEDGGFLFKTHYNLPFFQEISKAPASVINAHLISLTSIKESIAYEPRLKGLYEEGVKTLKEHIYLFDAGYWLRYDLNPRKEVLVQIDWLEGESSPLIETIELENPQTNKQTFIDVTSYFAFKNYPKISGSEWSEVKTAGNGRKGRSFVNGYSLHVEPVKKGARHNVYFIMALPDRKFDNYFTIPTYKLKIKYNDVAPGKFQLKVKPINLNDFHNFIPLSNAHITCVGYQKWKEIIIPIYPQELGWFVGPDYQQFHAEQLKLIGEQRDDWFFRQLGIRHDYFLREIKKDLGSEGL